MGVLVVHSLKLLHKHTRLGQRVSHFTRCAHTKTFMGGHRVYAGMQDPFHQTQSFQSHCTPTQSFIIRFNSFILSYCSNCDILYFRLYIHWKISLSNSTINTLHEIWFNLCTLSLQWFKHINFFSTKQHLMCPYIWSHKKKDVKLFSQSIFIHQNGVSKTWWSTNESRNTSTKAGTDEMNCYTFLCRKAHYRV